MREGPSGSLALHHVALGAADVERVAAFYRDIFGLPERARHRDGVGALRSGGRGRGEALLMIARSAAAPRRVDGVGRGLFLLAFRVTGEARAALEARLAAAGAPIEDRTDHTSYARDPEGNRIAVSAY